MSREQKELIIPAFSEESYQLARQRANDLHNNGTFSFLVTARQYENVRDLLRKVEVSDPVVIERALCRGIIFDPIVGQKDTTSYLSVFQLIAMSSSFPCFIVRQTNPTQYATILARNNDEQARINKIYVDKHGSGQMIIRLICSESGEFNEWSLEGLKNNDSHIIVCGNMREPFEKTWACSIFKKFANVIVVC